MKGINIMTNAICSKKLKPFKEFGGYTNIGSCLAVFWNSQICERQSKDIRLGSDGSITIKVFKKSQIGYEAYRHFFNSPEYTYLFSLKNTNVDFFDDNNRIGTVSGYDGEEEQDITLFTTYLDYDTKEIIVLTRGKNQ